jgi:hypothetical protein
MSTSTDYLPELRLLQESVFYSTDVTLTDATGNMVTLPGPSATTQTFIIPAEVRAAPSSELPPNKKNQRAHVIESLCLGGAACDELILNASGKYQARVTATIAFKRGRWVPDPSGVLARQRARDRVLIGRVLIQRANGEVVTASSAGLSVTPLANTAALRDSVATTRDGDLYTAPAPFGQILCGLTLSSTQGLTAIDFEVDPVSTLGPAHDLSTGDRVLFNVEAVFQVNPNAATPISVTASRVTYAVPFGGGINQWSFPDTGEKNASVLSRPIL